MVAGADGEGLAVGLDRLGQPPRPLGASLPLPQPPERAAQVVLGLGPLLRIRHLGNLRDLSSILLNGFLKVSLAVGPGDSLPEIGFHVRDLEREFPNIRGILGIDLEPQVPETVVINV